MATAGEFAKYVVDNMYRATLANALNISKSLCDLPIQVDKLAGVVLKSDNTAVASKVKETPSGLSYYFEKTNSWVPFYMTERKPTKLYEFDEFLDEIDRCVSEYLTLNKMNRIRACSIVAIVAKYRKMYENSYRGENVFKYGDTIYADEEMTREITPVNNKRYYDNIKGQKKAYVFADNKFVPLNLLNYQIHMIVDSFIMELWGCYQNGN